MQQRTKSQTLRSAYRWNTAGGIVNALQSVAVLMVLTRVCDVTAAGIFTFAYANGNLFLNVGKYGVRSFQSSDRSSQYSFLDYRATRLVTTAAMIVTGFTYLAYLAATNSYTLEKTTVIAVICLYEAVASIEDVFHGNFQQHDRLDVAAKLFTLRIATTIVVMCSAIAISHSIVIATIVATIYTSLFLVVSLTIARNTYSLPVPDGTFTRNCIGRILKTCFPLFAASFLLFYIGNAPRYAIDGIMGDVSQAYYGYIAMPVFVVSLLAGFIYNPMVTSLADQWLTGDHHAFAIRFGKLALAIVGVTVICDVGAFAIGVPVLDFLYIANTAPYLDELMVLVTGGGFLALASLAVLGITIIRFHRTLVPAYAVMTLIAWMLSDYMVTNWGITGAAWCYFACMALLAIMLSGLFLFGIRRRKRFL